MAELGRPTIYTEKLAAEICSRIASGESVRSIGRDETMPNAATIFDWALNNKSFSEQYEQARRIQADQMFEELAEIADDGSNDWMEKELQNGEIVDMPNHEHIQRSKLRVDTRKWALSKMLPKRFGDKLDVTSDGKPLNVSVSQEGAEKYGITPTTENDTE